MSLHKSYTGSNMAARDAPCPPNVATKLKAPVPLSAGVRLHYPSEPQLSVAKSKSVNRNKSTQSSSVAALNKSNSRNGLEGKAGEDRPSLLPRSLSSISTRPKGLTSSRSPAPSSSKPTASRIPLVSSSPDENAHQLDGSRRVLRRKAPSVGHHVSAEASAASTPKSLLDPDHHQPERRSSKSLPGDLRTASVNAVQIASARSGPAAMPSKLRSDELPPSLIPELKALAAASIYNRSASSTPHVPMVSSPSTQTSGSTVQWSSRDTTPTSKSSCSPGIVQPTRSKTLSRLPKVVPSPGTTPDSATSITRRPPTQSESVGSLNVNTATNDNNDTSHIVQNPRHAPKNKFLTPTALTPPTRKSSKTLQPATQTATQTAPPPSRSSSREKVRDIEGDAKSSQRTASKTAAPMEDSMTRDPPRRPSREGTAALESKLSPVVQSNMSPRSLQGYRRRESVDVSTSSLPSRGATTIGGTGEDSRKDPLASAERLYNRSNWEQIDSAESSSRLPVMATPPDPTDNRLVAKPSSKHMASESERSTLGKFSSRLGVFGRRSKSSRENANIKERRVLQKGPTAGTGHEGYGRYGRRGRKNSTVQVNTSAEQSNNLSSRSTLSRRNSQLSAAGSDSCSLAALDVREPGLDSDFSTTWPPFRNVLDDGTSLDLTNQLINEPAASIASDARSMSAVSVASDAPSSTGTHMRPTIFSNTVLNQTYPAHAPPSLDGYSTSQSSLAPDDGPSTTHVDPHSRASPRDLKKASKTGRMFKWNLFHRKANLEDPPQSGSEGAKSVGLSVAVTPVSVEKPIPFYALMDSEPDDDRGRDLNELIDELQESSSISAQLTEEPYGLGLHQQHGQSVLLPSMPTMSLEEPRDPPFYSPSGLLPDHSVSATQLPCPQLPGSTEHKRQRLPQVGRIPRVISRRDRQHKPAATSFSRPFQRDNLVGLRKESDYHTTAMHECERPILGIQTDVLPSRPFSSPGGSLAISAPAGPVDTRPLGDYETHPRSVVFHGSSADPFATPSSSEKDLHMVSLSPSAKRHHVAEEDEVWNEYDDLLDRVMSASPESTHSRQAFSGQPRSYSTYPPLRQARPESHLRLGTPLQTPRAAYPSKLTTFGLPAPLSSTGTSAINQEHYHSLRRSKKVAAFPQSSFATAISSNDHDSTSTVGDQALRGDTSIQSNSGVGFSPSYHRNFARSTAPGHHQTMTPSSMAENVREGPVGPPNLRSAALTTSRWLSFGRVLFSPAHEVVEGKREQHVLVLDGLGNDDWATFCAETYPNAMVHALRVADLGPAGEREYSGHKVCVLPNYRHLELSSLTEKFPFPSSFFAAVVVRFPAAMSDSSLKMAFSECKRVLVPGGYVELGVLDLDLVNMGTVARHAVRDLKARMIGADPEVSLKPAGDNIQDMLGERGFENLSRCVVSMPVAGEVATSSSSGSVSSRSSRTSYSHKAREAEAGGGWHMPCSNRSEPKLQREANFSPSDSDEKITKMVAKVGRWWYTRTYEWAVLPDGDMRCSIWSDKELLRECKAKGSGLKLLIAYAQKPIELKRRTLSEPIKPTAAIFDTRTTNCLQQPYTTTIQR